MFSLFLQRFFMFALHLHTFSIIPLINTQLDIFISFLTKSPFKFKNTQLGSPKLFVYQYFFKFLEKKSS